MTIVYKICFIWYNTDTVEISRRSRMDTYTQEPKNKVRHLAIKTAIDYLTTNRSNACCVRRSYVRDLYDFFLDMEESHEQTEVKKIDLNYIRAWEQMHAEKIGVKSPAELSVCYLSGPEPENDFNELVSFGVLPQNIWAFENQQNTYLKALQSIDTTNYMQPKIIKASIENFFESTPKKFDIVYIDACAPLISDQHALRCISSLFKYHRLESPGVLISNFADVDQSNPQLQVEFEDIIARYFYIKENSSASLVESRDNISLTGNYENYTKQVKKNFETYYGNFITAMICNSASISVPLLRFCHSPFLKHISTTTPLKNKCYDFIDVNTIKNNTLLKFFAMNNMLHQKRANFAGIARCNRLASELGGSLYSNEPTELLSCLQKLYDIRNLELDIQSSLNDALAFFDNGHNMYQFLDKPNKMLFFDSVINQLSYPMHYSTENTMRLTYKAKQTRMFTDLIVFDECRYIYDWLPAIHQIPNAFSNPSWQYTFRFALDGLVKQRMNYNNEFFFQGSVVNKNEPLFCDKKFLDRIKIN